MRERRSKLIRRYPVRASPVQMERPTLATESRKLAAGVRMHFLMVGHVREDGCRYVRVSVRHVNELEARDLQHAKSHHFFNDTDPMNRAIPLELTITLVESRHLEDLETEIACYERDATVVVEPGTTISGPEAIRARILFSSVTRSRWPSGQGLVWPGMTVFGRRHSAPRRTSAGVCPTATRSA